MSSLLVPHQATSRSVTVWVGTLSEPPAGLALRVGARQAALGGWTTWAARGEPKFWSTRVTVDALDPGRRYPLRLLDGETELASGTAVTLPDELPTLGEQPFICLLGSCFARFSDGAGAAGAAYAALPVAARPHVKFLTGDQVYLDAPFPRYLYNVYGEEDLQAELLATYVETWMQGSDGWGFSELLRSGATYFSSDDHEVWNNAPAPTPVVRATWWPFGDRGAAWWRLALALYDTFQSSSRSEAFRVGRMSFKVIDTRLDRSLDRSRFTDPAEMAALGAWVDALDGPGAIVLGQPVFVAPRGVKGHITDWGLVDFAQYEELIRIISRTRHDLLVLTGDVHYGRVAGCRLPNGASVIEIIASPFALVDRRVGGKWHPPPPVFPAGAVPGAMRSEVWLEEGHQLADDQFATLEFAADGARVQLTVRSWAIPRPGRPPTATTVFQRTLD